MPRGRKNLQEMETGTKQSRTAVNAGAKPAEPMPHLTTGIPDGQRAIGWEDLGGPTVDNYKPDNDSAKLRDPAAILAQVRNVVNSGAKAAEAAKKMKEDYEDEYELDENELDEYEELDEGSCEDEEEDKEDDDKEESPRSKRKAKKEKDEEDEAMKEEIEEIESRIREDVDALLSGEELSEEFKFKAKTVFEAALNTRTEQIEEAILRKYEDQLSEEVEEIAEALSERVDSYLEYVADEWLKENALAIDQGLRNEFTESFLFNLKNLFEEHYVSIPEERYDVLESMVEKLDEMETKLNEQIETNVALNQRLAEAVTDSIISEMSEGLALSQKEKLASLAENVEFDGENSFREKLATLREAYFSEHAVTPRSTQDYLVETVTETVPYNTPSGAMEVYLNALERASRK